MQRAQQKLQLLHSHIPPSCTAATTATDLLKEWDYGDYEWLRSSESWKQVPGGKWDIWTDGCLGGESPQQVEARCGRLIEEIKERWHRHGLEGKGKGDVICAAHGHLLRAFATRWIGRRLSEGVPLVLEAGGVGTLSYGHGNIGEPAILLGGAFVVGDEGAIASTKRGSASTQRGGHSPERRGWCSWCN
ncbi:histidine phosphatase superfamily [Sphaerosporella brunnea]|uniref:Histidine phosphatase superfamily n=1 Tax=Sphaerosporella brunnea TaxID=1250544 RepID=A0A5J5F050_9PEZI|nr:histidine phosphatase superfamily [Sphaerosporella brunnea]